MYKVSSFLLGFLATFPNFLSSLDLNCTTESFMLFDDTEYDEANWNKSKYMFDMCDKGQANNVCTCTNTTNGTRIHGKAIINMTSTEAEKIRNELKSACHKAGGQFVLETFDIGLKSDKMNFYDVETLDVSITGHPDCVGFTTCKNATDVGDFLKYGWAYFFNASVYNFSIYKVIWDNTTASQ